VFVEPNDDTLSNDGADEDDEAGGFDTTMMEDMRLNVVLGRVWWMVLAVAVASDSEGGVETLSVCAPCGLG
jgi:hypothetical protein